MQKTGKSGRRRMREVNPSLRLNYVGGWKHRIPQGPSCALHSHPNLELVFHRKGGGVTRLSDGIPRAFREGDVVLYGAGVEHDQVMDNPGEDLCVHFALPRGAPLQEFDCLVISNAGAESRRDIEFLTGGRVPRDAVEKSIYDHRVTALVLTLLYRRGQRAGSDGGSAVDRAERFIQDHYGEIENLGEVAAHVGISHDHLRHLFKAQRGMTMIHYLNQVRIERARSLLAHSILPLKQIADQCGYRDEYYFSHVFRRYTGFPPGEYRKTEGVGPRI